MQLNYIILAHQQPQSLLKLVKRLNADEVFFFIHIDKSKDIAPFERLLNRFPNVHFFNETERQYGSWGGFGIVKASINALRTIIDRFPNDLGRCILLSGQDYPLATNQKIKAFFESNKNTEYITSYSMPFPGWKNGGMDRLLTYRFYFSKERGDFICLPSIWEKSLYTKKNIKGIYRLAKQNKIKNLCKLLKKRRFPNNLLPYGGSQWWNLTIATVKKILTFLENNPSYIKYHEDTLLGDEIFFQSILQYLQIKDASIDLKRSLTYINWEQKDVPLPVTFEKKDFEELEEASKNHLFARKFDFKKSKYLLSLIDKHLLND
jgi:hypothetical protein